MRGWLQAGHNRIGFNKAGKRPLTAAPASGQKRNTRSRGLSLVNAEIRAEPAARRPSHPRRPIGPACGPAHHHQAEHEAGHGDRQRLCVSDQPHSAAHPC